MLPSTLLAYLVSWLPSWLQQANDGTLTLHLRHVHAHSGSRIFFQDVKQASLYQNASFPNPYPLRTRKTKTYKTRTRESFDNARWRSIDHGESTVLDWDEEEVLGPNVEDRETLLLLAKMTYNA